MTIGYKRVFAALDAGSTQRYVMQRAMRIAANDGAALCLGHAVDAVYADASVSDMERLAQRVEAQIREDLADLLEQAENDPNIPSVQLRVVAGGLLDTLEKVIVHDFNPDLVLCSKRGFSTLRYAFVGSVSSHLIRHLDCDVLVLGPKGAQVDD